MTITTTIVAFFFEFAATLLVREFSVLAKPQTPKALSRTACRAPLLRSGVGSMGFRVQEGSGDFVSKVNNK